MTLSTPLISVIMPSFRQVSYLDEAIRSVLDQDYPHRELIIMDGGSEDGSMEVILSHAERLAYWKSAPDAGQSDAIDRGLAHARGDLLCWVNSDDVLLPGALSAVAKVWAASGRCDWIAGNCVWLDPGGRVVRCLRGMRWSGVLARFGFVNVSAPASFFSRKLYQSVGGLNLGLHYAMDTDLWIRFADSGARFVRCHRYLWGLRLHPAAKTSGHKFSTSPMALRDHPGKTGQRAEVKRIFDDHHRTSGDLRIGSVVSRVLRSSSGASALAWFDYAHWRGEHWTKIRADDWTGGLWRHL
jgi:glycosyltransferase involved in cell wall biosynthesis